MLRGADALGWATPTACVNNYPEKGIAIWQICAMMGTYGPNTHV
jgi:hypothetical protein